MGTASMAHKSILGESQRAFAENVRARKQELHDSGLVKPYTVVNFNPVALVLEGELSRYRVPSPDDERLPKDVSRVSLEYNGREWLGHALLIPEPHFFGRMANASAFEGDIASAIPEREVKYYLPNYVAFTFLEHFSPIFVTKEDGRATPPPKDARRIYGVLAFEGTLRTLIAEVAKLKIELQMEAAGRKVSPENEAMIDVPLARVNQVGRTINRTVTTVRYSLRKYLDQMFEGQLRFCQSQLAWAQAKWSETGTVNEISESHRTWYRWAIRMGYADAPKRGEKHWLNELITVDGFHSEGLGGQPRRKCQACRSEEPEPGTPFCPKCSAPIDTFATFMAGFPVAEAWLQALKGEQRAEALAEMERRREGFGPQEEDSRQQAAPRAKQARGTGGQFQPRKATPGEDDIPAAPSTELPGEEQDAKK